MKDLTAHLNPRNRLTGSSVKESYLFVNEQLLEAEPHAKDILAGHLRTTPLWSEAIVGAVDAEIGFPTGTQKRPPSTTDRQTHVFLIVERSQTARKLGTK